MRQTATTLALSLLLGGFVAGADLERWVPDHCLVHLDTAESEPEASLWSRAYRDGFDAIQRGSYDVAEREMCAALMAARSFDARDWRFAETFDELGLIAFQLRDFELAERMQGAAIAEMLLAAGPRGEPFEATRPSDRSVIRPDCASGVRVYTERLDLIHERLPGRMTTDAIRGEPWSIFATGYIPLDSRLAGRLEWLISRYLLEENLTAADALIALRDGILDGGSGE